MVMKVYNEELFRWEYKGDFYTVFPEVEFGDARWFFSIDENSEVDVRLTIFELDSVDVNDEGEFMLVQPLFSFHRNYDGRNIYNFGEVIPGEVATDVFHTKMNGSAYVYNSGVAGYEDTGGVEWFANLLVTSTQVANQLMNKAKGTTALGDMLYFLNPVTDKVFSNNS